MPRILPKKTRAVIHGASWPRPEVFQWLQSTGNVAESEMWRVFNCGIGMVLVLAREHVSAAKALLEREGETVFEIGAIEESSGEPDAVIA